MVLPGNAQAIGRRAEQQDAFAFSDLADAAFCAHSGALCVVCDGMGGHAAGGEAARAAVARFLGCYCTRDTAEPIERSLARALDAANEAVLEVAAQAGDSGSTLVAAVIHGGQLHWTSLGDSRLWLLRAGRLHRINREHRYRGELLRRAVNAELPWAEALADPLGERLTASLGESPMPAADASLRPWPLRPGDQVLLATDGLYRSVDTAHLERIAAVAVDKSSPGPQRLCDRWAELALAADLPDQDNLTVAGLAWQPEAVAGEPAALATGPSAALTAVANLSVTAPLPPTPPSAPEADAPTPGARPPRFHRPIALAALALGGAAATWLAQRGDDAPPSSPLPAPTARAASQADGMSQAPDRPKRTPP